MIQRRDSSAHGLIFIRRKRIAPHGDLQRRVGEKRTDKREVHHGIAPEHWFKFTALTLYADIRSFGHFQLTYVTGHNVPFGRAYRQRLKDLDHPMWALIS